MSETLKAKITGIEKKVSKKGNAGIIVHCNHQDGSEWGLRIRDWITWDSEYDFIFKRWAELVKPNCTLEEARQILVGESWALIGMDVSLEVEDGDFGKNVKKVIIDDGIPF
tara:strand:+ start:9469 stop:9801 length:333 start_codon:yes stop_codon:yes gene_type:complete